MQCGIIRECACDTFSRTKIDRINLTSVCASSICKIPAYWYYFTDVVSTRYKSECRAVRLCSVILQREAAYAGVDCEAEYLFGIRYGIFVFYIYYYILILALVH